MFKLAWLGFLMNSLMLALLNERGEGGAGGEGAAAAETKEKEFTPEQQKKVDAIVQERLARDRAKYSDYEELKTFKTEHQKQVDAQAQKDLEARKEYDTAKQTYEKKIGDLQGVVIQKEAAIFDMKIAHTLTTEIAKQKGYVEEASAILRGQTVLDKDGNVRIKGRDANQLETLLPVEEGVKAFLTARPYLMQASGRGGAGSGDGTGGAGGAGAGAAAGDLNSLINELGEAQVARDFKRVGEIKIKMKAAIDVQRRK